MRACGSGASVASGNLDAPRMNEELHRLIEQRAYELWEEADRPDARELEFWLQAEHDVGGLLGAREADPFMAVDDLDPGEFSQREQSVEHGAGQRGTAPLRRSVEQAVPPAERLPTAADENPISERVREAGEGLCRTRTARLCKAASG